MTDPGRDVESMITRLFENKVGHERVLEAEGAALLRDLWDTVADLGLPWVGVAEEAGGSGGSIADVVTLLRGVGQFAVPLPLLENHLAAWLWTTAGGEIAGTGPWSVAPGTPRDSLVVEGARVSGTVHDVAWGRAVDGVVALVETDGVPLVLLLDPAAAEVSGGRDLAGQPRDALTFSGGPAALLTSTVTTDELARRGAVLRAAQMAGAMAAISELTQHYTAQRQQFGRPIGKFQAVRTHLVHLAQMAVMTGLCVDRAAAALEAGRDASFDAFATKLLANQNAAVSIRAGHQAHGATGMTREYALQDHTRRLNAWRGDWGSELALADRVGGAVLAAQRIARVATDEGSLSV
jgi:acyl-CoA dehydrogenase